MSSTTTFMATTARRLTADLTRIGARLRLKASACCPATHDDAGIRYLGPVDPGRYEVFRRDRGAVLVLVALPKRDGGDYEQHFVHVDAVDRFFVEARG